MGIANGDTKYCLVQKLEPMAGVINNFDCPLYFLTTTFELRSASAVAAEVSFVHECDDACTFTDVSCYSIERESVSVDKLQFVHDYDINQLYCLNVFCMNQ